MGKNTNSKCVNVHYFFITLKSLQKGKKNGTCLFKGCDIYERKVEFVLLGWHGQKQNGGERLYLVCNKIKLSRKRQKSNCNKSKYKFLLVWHPINGLKFELLCIKVQIIVLLRINHLSGTLINY